MKGKFRPRNPRKYGGDPTKIIFRSGWELKLMIYWDDHPDVIKWASEQHVVPYRDETTNKIRRYYPDFVVKFKDKTGKIQTMMVEVKPLNRIQQPRPGNGPSYIKEMREWGKNQCKWKAAREYCARRGWQFVLKNEYDLGIRKRDQGVS